MAKRTDTLESTRIALELLRRIPRNQSVSAKVLQQQLQDAGFTRSERTIQRLLDSLSEQFDIERNDRSKPYSYKWKALSTGLNLTKLSEQESLLLQLAKEQLRHLLPANLMNSLSSFFEQAQYNLGSALDGKLAKEWLTKVRVVRETQPLLPPKIANGVFEAVSNALYANCWLSLDYRNASGKKTTAKVMPLGLAQQGPRLYLVCRYEGFDDERSLAVNRILKAEATLQNFERPKNFNLERYDDDGRFGFGEGKRIRLSFRIEKNAGQHLLESPLSKDQVVTEEGDCFRIAATVVQTGRLEWWLRGFGGAVWEVKTVRTKVEKEE